MFSDCRTEWRIADIERELRSKPNDYEVSSIRSDVDSLERTVREPSTLVTGLQYELEACQSELSEIRQREAL